MFEQEVELEKHESSIVPLLLIVALILTLVGVAGYQLRESRKVLSKADAANVVIGVLKAEAPPTVSFHTGSLVASVADKPSNPQYRLLEKLGVLKLGPGNGYDHPVSVKLTPKGEQLLAQIPGVQRSKEKDGSELYVVPLAEKRLVDISKIEMVRIGRANIAFSWKWETNALGADFDAAGPLVKTFNTWDRGTLIDKYGVQFYHEAPTTVAMALAKTDKGWQPAVD